MVLLSQVEWWDDAALECTATSHLADANPLRRFGRLSSLCAIEYGAQAIAAHGALLASGPPDPGFLVSVRDFELWAVTIDEVGPVLAIRAHAVRRDGRGAIYDVSVGSPSTPVAAGRIGVLLARSP
jgi:predicted hotdog family 3-hydroxylacyl-ACP dehydratase